MSEIRRGRPEAAAVVWQSRRRDVQVPESAAKLRLRGLAQAAIGIGIGLVVRRYGSPAFGTVIVSIASTIFLVAMVSPTGLFAALDRAFQRLGVWVGRALTWLLLVPVFYLFFMPFGRLLRRGSRDRMKRALDPSAPTYWEPHDGQTAASDSRERQF